MGNLWYKEPKTLDVAFDIISNVVINMASCQHGGYTICEVDKLLSKYAQKSYDKYYQEYCDSIDELKKTVNFSPNGFLNDFAIKIQNNANEYAIKKVYRDFEQDFQSWEMRFNSVGSSRGDYPFISISFGLGAGFFEKMASEVLLKVRMNGQGKIQTYCTFSEITLFI